MSTAVSSNFTLTGFRDWLMKTPDTVVSHKDWPTCALGKYVMICEGLEHAEPHTIGYEELDYELMRGIKRLAFETTLLPMTLYRALEYRHSARDIAPTHRALANHIRETYL